MENNQDKIIKIRDTHESTVYEVSSDEYAIIVERFNNGEIVLLAERRKTGRTEVYTI